MFVTLSLEFGHASDLKSTFNNLPESCHRAQISRNLCCLCYHFKLRMLLKTFRFEAKRILIYIATCISTHEIETSKFLFNACILYKCLEIY